MSKACRLFILLLISFSAKSQSWEWARELDPWSDFSRIKEDAFGNKYTVRNDQHTPDSINFALRKADPNGNFVWELKIGNAWMNSYVLAPTGDVYLVGNIYDTAAFDTHVLVPVQGYTNAFICRVSPGGTISWARQEIGQGYFDLSNITSDFSNNLYISGRFGFRAILGDSTQLSSLSGSNFFIANYNLSGNLEWVKEADHNTTSCLSSGKGIMLDNSHNILVNIETCNNDYRADSVKYQGTYFDAVQMSGTYLMKLDTIGNLKWKINHSGYRYGIVDMKVDPYDNIILAGNSCCYPVTPWLRKYDQNGILLWYTTTIAAPHLDAYYSAVAVDHSGNIYATGVRDSGNYGVAYRSMFVDKYTSAGNELWIKTAGKPHAESEICVPKAIEVQPDGIYITGTYSDSIYFDTLLLQYHSNNGFIAKIGEAQAPDDVKPVVSNAAVTVFPNPTEGKLTVYLGESKNARICVYDVMGNCIYSKQVNDADAAKIDLGAAPGGLYFIEVTSGKEKTVRRIGLN